MSFALCGGYSITIFPREVNSCGLFLRPVEAYLRTESFLIECGVSKLKV